jgi:single-stranded-DNA-specific exonuclease
VTEPFLRELAAPFAGFVAGLAPGRPVAVLCHGDCDGIGAGAILVKALGRLGHAVAVEVTGKGGSAWAPDIAPRLARHAPQALTVADLGCRAEPVLPGVPTCFIDHHRPEGVPPGATLITGYGSDPTPTSGLLALASAESVGAADGLGWIAAIATISDLGDAAPFRLMTDVRQKYKITHLKDATALLNAARRSAAGDAKPALDLLLKAAGPKDVTTGDYPEVEYLKRAKAEVAGAFAEAKRAAPKVVGDVALVRVRSPCQIHPMVVQIWRTRLGKNIVLVANAGYVPGQVNFAVRSARDVNLIDFLREKAPPDPGPNYGHGHDRATGGALKFPQWNAFIRGLGFGPEAEVNEATGAWA